MKKLLAILITSIAVSACTSITPTKQNISNLYPNNTEVKTCWATYQFLSVMIEPVIYKICHQTPSSLIPTFAAQSYMSKATMIGESEYQNDSNIILRLRYLQDLPSGCQDHELIVTKYFPQSKTNMTETVYRKFTMCSPTDLPQIK